MRIFHGFQNDFHIPAPVATIGSFDGVHLGHRALLAELERVARERGGSSVVVTFEPHPRLTLEGDSDLRLLCTTDEKLELLREAGVENVIIVPFDRQFASLSAEEFIRDMLVARLHIDTLMVGFNHRLGCDKGGSGELCKLAEKHGFRIADAPRFEVQGCKVSSSAIRRSIGEGKTGEAIAMLGRPYSVSGKLDRDSIFIPDDPLKIMPPAGIYRTEVVSGGECGAAEASIDMQGTVKLKNCKIIACEQAVKLFFL